MRFATSAGIVSLFVTLLLPTTAFAGLFDVCGYAYFFDERDDRSGIYGGRIPSNSGVDRPVPYVHVELWDMDGDCEDYSDPNCAESDDDLLDTDVTSASGYYCFEDIGNLEDIYVRAPGRTEWSEIRIPLSYYGLSVPWSVAQYPARVDFASGSGTYHMNFGLTCWDDDATNVDGKCNNSTQAYADFSDELQFSNLMSAMADIDKALTDSDFSHNSHSDPIWLYYPEGPLGECTGGAAGQMLSYDEICIRDGDWNSNHTVAHETGHVIMARALGTTSLSAGTCPSGATGWSTTLNQKCATSEGWANFFALAVYYYPWAYDSSNQIGPKYNDSSSRNAEGLTDAGNGPNDFNCVSYLTSPHRNEGNVTRFFWDVYDSVTGPEDDSSPTTCSGSCSGCTSSSYEGDNTSLSLSTMILYWNTFLLGTSDRRHQESGDHGRNAYDYEHYAAATCAELHQNCLTSQEAN